VPEVPDYPLAYHYGDTFSAPSWQWLDAAGAAQNITGYTASMKVKTDDGTEVLHLNTADGTLTIPTGTDGKVIPAATSVQMLAGSLQEEEAYEYDIKVFGPAGEPVKTLTKGVFRVDKRVTDA